MVGVRLRAPGPSGHGTTLTDVESGVEIKGISRISLEIVPDDIIRIGAEIFSSGIDVNGALDFYVADPSTGEAKRPARIEFSDGSVWTA